MPPERPKTKPEPHLETVGAVTLRIHQTTAGSYVFKYPRDGKLIQVRRAALADARTEANRIATIINRGNARILSMTPADAETYARILTRVEPVGKSPELAIEEWVFNQKRLPKDVSQSRAVDYYLEHCDEALPERTPEQVLGEMSASKRQDGLSARHVEDLENRCQKFADTFTRPLASITATQIDGWLRGMPVGGRTRNNYRVAVQTLFSFARARGYLPRDWRAMAGVATAKASPSEIEIYTPAEMAKLLKAAPAKILTFLLLGGFAGIRSAEFCRLAWADVWGRPGYITVTAGKAKTAARRLVPLLPNLAAWLRPFRKRTGPMWAHGHTYLYEVIEDVTAAAGVTWKANGLRHSFISYRVAQIQDVPQVALEAGNSPRKIFEHYRELVGPKEARKWFGIMPAKKRVAKR